MATEHQTLPAATKVVTIRVTAHTHIAAVIPALTHINDNTQRQSTLIPWVASEQLDLMEVINIAR